MPMSIALVFADPEVCDVRPHGPMRAPPARTNPQRVRPLQVAVSIALVFADPEMCDARSVSSWPESALRFAFGMLVMDAWQYFIHR